MNAKYAVDGGMQTRWAANELLPTLTISLDPTKEFNKVTIFECQDTRVAEDQFTNYRTNRIQKYEVNIWEDNEWKTIYLSDQTMGDCKVIRLPRSYKTSKLQLKVLDATAPPAIYEINVINMHNRER